MSRFGLSVFVLVVSCVIYSHALIHHLEIRHDTRGKFFIENFGFEVAGTLRLNCTNLTLDPAPLTSKPPGNIIGFYITYSLTDSPRFIEENEDGPSNSTCLLQIKPKIIYERVLPFSSWDGISEEISIHPKGPGFYNVYFISCLPRRTKISFDLDLVMFDPGPNYLSIGETVEPTIYFFFTFVYAIVFCIWVYGFLRGTDGKKVFTIHYLMTVLLVLKLLSVLFHGLELYFKKTTGFAGGWGVVYYILTSLRGIMLFVVIALIGTGWAFIKPYLSERDKQIFVVVIPLQILDNIALVVVEATAPGSQGWFTWQDIFRVVDIICCLAIIIPIIWSIRHLKEASAIDGKATNNLEKLKMFRHFYLIVVSYIYFTRIIVYLLDATLPFRWTWFGVFVSELATLAFYFITGYLFRPVANNPYLKTYDEDAEGGIQMQEMTTQS